MNSFQNIYDVSSSKKVITFGELLMRLDVPGNARFEQATSFHTSYGGTEANVAVNLTKLGLPSKFVSVLPDNDLGRAALGNLLKSGVDLSDVKLDGKKMGLYFHEEGTMLRSSSVIYDREGSAFAKIQLGQIDWEKALEGFQWFHWSGVTPAVSKEAADVCLAVIKIAKRLGMTVSVDLNIRQKLWNWGKEPSEVLPEMLKSCDIILGNEEHIKELLSFPLETEGLGENTRQIGRKLKSLYPNIQKVIVTWRRTISANHNKISAALWDDDDTYEGKVIDIPDILDRVGSGDALMSGVIYGLIQFGDDLQKTVDFAIACSAMKHTIPGDLNLSTSSEVMSIVNNQSLGVKR